MSDKETDSERSHCGGVGNLKPRSDSRKLLPTHQVNILKQNTKLMFEFLHDFYVYLYQTVCFIFPFGGARSLADYHRVTSASLVSSTLPGTRWHSIYLWGNRRKEEMKEGINKWHGRAYSILTKKPLFCEQRNPPPLNFDFAIKKIHPQYKPSFRSIRSLSTEPKHAFKSLISNFLWCHWEWCSFCICS